MIPSPSPFLMVKPECAPHLAALETVITSEGYSIKDIYAVHDWKNVARAIYQSQHGQENEEFWNGFEAHAWVLNQFFGNRSLILSLQAQTPDDADTLDKLAADTFRIKERFRIGRKGCYEGSAVVLIDTLKIPELGYLGQEGVIGTQQHQGGENKFSPFDEKLYAPGQWDYIYFKYVHCPDPAKERLLKEWAVLEQQGIISEKNKLSISDWTAMKLQNTLIPPR